MEPELVKRWTDALRSGKYKESKSKFGCFKDTADGYCPLGVLGAIQNWEFIAYKSQMGFREGKAVHLCADMNGLVTDSTNWPKIRGVNWPQPDVADRVICMFAEQERGKKIYSFLDIAYYIEGAYALES